MRCALLLVILAGCSKPEERVTLYSAQDRDFAEPVLAQFELESRLRLQSKFDTEANKSVSLANELMAEKASPRCDVHWNNEPINTIRLARAGIYADYASPAAAGFPEWTRSALYQFFAARARVLIVNTNLVPEARHPTSLFDMTKPEWKGQVVMAKPMFGTTASHAACLFAALGDEKALAFFRALKDNDVGIVAGNKQVAVGVSQGKFAFGLTDTDDAIIEQQAGRPVALIYPDRDGHPEYPALGVLYLPNTLALINGAPNSSGGKKLIDYLLTQETTLARGGGFQIPLNPALADDELLPALVPPGRVKRMDTNFEKAADKWEAAQAALRDLFAR